MNRPAPKRRTWTKVHLSFFLTPSHLGIGPDALLLMVLVFCLARWDGESEHAEARDEMGKIIPLSTLSRYTQLAPARAQAALAAAVECGTLALGPDGAIVIPNFRRWQEDPSAKRVRKHREKQEAERLEHERLERERLEQEQLEHAHPPDAPLEEPSGALSPRRHLAQLERRHQEFLEALPPGPRRFRVVKLLGTPSELATGLARETEWVAQVLFEGDLEPAQRLVLEVFEYAWQQAYDGKLEERYLAKSLWGQAFRARVREWADARRSDSTDGEGPRHAGPNLTWEQLAALSAEAAKDLKRRSA